MGDKLNILNVSQSDFTVQTILIPAGGSYTVPDANIIAFAQDGYLQTLIFQQMATVTSYSCNFGLNSMQWLELVARGTVVLS